MRVWAVWQRWGSSRARAYLLACCVCGGGQAVAGPNQEACRVAGLPNEVVCGSLARALDPTNAASASINVHYVVLPARARNKRSDAVLVLAGGPGQSAIDLAAAVLPRFSRLNNQRDLVFIDQRGTGRSAPLLCEDDSALPLNQLLDTRTQVQRLRQCAQDLARLAHGDLRYYTTPLAVADMEALRAALGIARWNLVGGSYGTRVALEYLRQFPQSVRRTVLDGVAPADMALPLSFARDGQAALEALFSACAADAGHAHSCAQRYPRLRQDWADLLQSLPKSVQLSHPLTGQPEAVTLHRDAVLRLVRTPLYVPTQASALPQALTEAARGRFDALVGLSAGGGHRRKMRMAMGMHFSVICSEDMARIPDPAPPVEGDFAHADVALYRAVCAFWPQMALDPAYYRVAAAASPVLVLSGGIDPVTPPRHGAAVAQALGARAQHVVVAQAGHGVLGLACVRDLVHRFITEPDDTRALPLDADCAARIPRPPVFVPVRQEGA